MNFKEKKATQITQYFAYIVMYIIFTTLLFFALSLTHKLPQTWTYFHIMMITLLIVLIGRLINLLLK